MNYTEKDFIKDLTEIGFKHHKEGRDHVCTYVNGNKEMVLKFDKNEADITKMENMEITEVQNLLNDTLVKWYISSKAKKEEYDNNSTVK